MTQPGFEVVRRRPGDDLGAEVDLAHRSFGPASPESDASWRAELGSSAAACRLLGAVAGGRLLSSASWYDMRQWWRGRQMPMAGVTAVMVAPEYRGRGVARALMTALLEAAAGGGYPVAALYAAAPPLYRSLGFEVAGYRLEAVLDAVSLRSLLPPDTALGELPDAHRVAPRRAAPADAAEVLAAIGAAHSAAGHCGPATFTEERVARLLGKEGMFWYLAAGGALGYGWGQRHELRVECLAAPSAAAARALWSVLASHSSIAERVRVCLAPADPVGWLAGDRRMEVAEREPWMLRVLDAPAAIRGRGFPPSAEVAVTLRLADEQLPANAGTWDLAVGGGEGSLTPVRTHPAGHPHSAEPVRLGARGFAALFAGVPMATLRCAGLVAGGCPARGDPAGDAALDSAFAGPAFMLGDF